MKMFGGNIDPPKFVKHPKVPYRDINLTSVHADVYGHMGRQANSNYFVRMMHHKQRMQAVSRENAEREASRLKAEAASFRYAKQSENKYFQRLIDKRIEEKLLVHDEALANRRKKLKELFCEEQRQLYHETVEQSQKACHLQLESLKNKTREMEEKREEERRALVAQKKLEQFREQCQELRPFVWRSHLVETKQTQLRQIEENAAKRATELELEQMWHVLKLKEIRACEERERQTVMRQHVTNKQLTNCWAQQIRGKELLLEEKKRIVADDKLEMNTLTERLRAEQLEEVCASLAAKKQRSVELRAQIDAHQNYVNQYRNAEIVLDQEFARLARIEEQKEREKKQTGGEIARREIAIYREYLQELEEARLKETLDFERLLEEHRRAIQIKQDAAICRRKEQRTKLHQDVLEGRREQLEERRQRAAADLELKQIENELLRLDCLAYEQETEEHCRLLEEANRRHYTELKQQMEANARVLIYLFNTRSIAN